MPEFRNYPKYILYGVLLFFLVAAGWLTLHAPTQIHVTAGLVIAVWLYVFRKYHRIVYGICEVLAGIAALVQTYPIVQQTCGTFAEFCRPFQWYVIPLATLIAIYIIIRGFITSNKDGGATHNAQNRSPSFRMQLGL